MGAFASAEIKSDFCRACSSFTSFELNYYNKLFDTLASKTSASDEKCIDQEAFEVYLKDVLDKNFARKFFDAFCCATANDEAIKASLLSREAFFIGLYQLLKNGTEEKATIFCLVCGAQGKDTIHLDEIIAALDRFSSCYVKILSTSPIFAHWNFENADLGHSTLVEYYSNDLLKHLSKTATFNERDKVVPVDLVQKWLRHDASLVLDMMSCTLSSSFEKTLPNGPFIFPPIPTPVHVKDTKSLLNLASLLVLSNSISLNGSHSSFDDMSQQSTWRLLYNSNKHGESFTNMLKSIMDEGPVLVVVKEKHSGHVFGGYCSTNMNMNPHFVGDDRSFVFSLLPHIRVYEATGFNTNYAYLNAYQATMPNGLGFGGRLQVEEVQVHFFALWIDQDFGKGKSQKGCSSFNSPQLSSEENFSIDCMEVWGVGPKPDSNKRRDSKSVLDSNPEIKAMLSMTGKGPVSEGLRDFDDTADMPEERKFSNA